MRKIILILLTFLLAFTSTHAQFFTNEVSVKASQLGIALNNIDEIFVFDSITSSTSITFSNPGPIDIKWYRYLTAPALTPDNLLLSQTNVTSPTLEISTPSVGYSGNGDQCGYVLQYDDGSGIKFKYIWVFDLKNANIVIGSITADNIGVNPCFSTHLTVNLPTYSNLDYFSSLGVLNTIPRKFIISYNTLQLNEPQTIEIEKTNLGSGSNDITVAAPFVTTKFTIAGDQFFKAFNKTKIKSTDADYTPLAVEATLKAVVAERSAKNEVTRTTPGGLGGSAPLVVDFTSNANTPVAQFFEWKIRAINDTSNVALYTDKDLRYTFKNAGLYKIKLTVSNATCIVSDSINATVIASSLNIPDVFTPNGDGKNDEFRVAFSSLISFHGIIFNRWGRKVFEWTDPGKGWDGRIGGKMAVPTAYYYIIEAVGSDIDPITKKPIQYKRKGDINLLRGK